MTEHSAATGAGDEYRPEMLMRLAAQVLRDHAADAYPIFYDEAECDGSCLADDLEGSADALATSCQQLRAKDAEIERLTAEVAMWKGLQDGTVAATRAEIERLTKALADLAGWAMSAAKNELPASLIRANDILASTSASIGFATIWNAPGIGPMFTQLCTRVSGGCAKDAEIARLTNVMRLTEDALNGLRDDALEDRHNTPNAIPLALLLEHVAAGIRAALKEQDHD